MMGTSFLEVFMSYAALAQSKLVSLSDTYSEMAWRGQQDDIPLAWNLTSFLQNFTGVVESCMVLALCFVHYIAFRALRSSGLRAPCSCHTRLSKDLNDPEHVDALPKVETGGVTELVTSDGVIDCRLGQLFNADLADSRYESGGVENKSSSSVGSSKGEEQVDVDKEQNLKDTIKYEALQVERETSAALYSELEQERNCSASAASEALAMISRLQEEKAAVQLEARQFQRMVQEKAMFDQEAIEALNELLVNREEEKFALVEEIRVCRERLNSLMKEEMRQSLKPKAIVESSDLNQIGKVVDTSKASEEVQPIIVDKLSTATNSGCENSSLVPFCKINNKVEEFGESNVAKSETMRCVSLSKTCGVQEVSLTSNEETKQERRREEHKVSVQEFIRIYEQQQAAARLPVLQSVTKHISGGPGSEMRGGDVSERPVSKSWTKYEGLSGRFTRGRSMRRRLFQEDIRHDERYLNGYLSFEEAEDGASSDRCCRCLDFNKPVHGGVHKVTDGKEGWVEDGPSVRGVHEGRRLRVKGSFKGGDRYFFNPIDVYAHRAIPSDCLGNSEMYSFEGDEERDQESELDPTYLIPPSCFYQCVDDVDKDS